MRFAFYLITAFFLLCRIVVAQVEHVPVQHPVYDLLMRWEAAKVLNQDFSSSALPLQRKEIVEALKAARRNEAFLSAADVATLVRFEREFGIAAQTRSVVFPSGTDSTSVLFARLLSDDEKFLFRYHDSDYSVSVSPLAAVDYRITSGSNDPGTALLAEVGGRVFGTLDSALGFFLQGTNGGIFSGDRNASWLQNDPRLRQNLTWRLYSDGNSGNFDFSESHLRYDKRWFYAGIGRETRLVGSGYFTRTLYSNNAPASDAFMLGARFSGFEYRFMHFSLLGQPEPNPNSFGAGTTIPTKYMAHHRFAFRGTWGEIGVSEQLIYSRRGLDVAYLLPLNFLRSISNALRDRDNLQMALDLTLRPFAGIQLKGNFVLDDLRFGEIGNGYWANKTAWNVGVMFAPSGLPVDATLEYARVEPYTFSHFDVQNAATNDGQLFAGILQPNSDELTARLQCWFGGRYPFSIKAAWMRHGANIVDVNGNLVRNVGGSELQTLRSTYDPHGQRIGIDSERVTFLDGNLESRFTLAVTCGMELARQWNVQARYQLVTLNALTTHYIGIVLRFEDF